NASGPWKRMGVLGMKRLSLVMLSAGLFVQPALAEAHDDCSLRSLAGKWMFATDVGRQNLFPGGDITAIGTFKLDKRGNAEGIFDATIEEYAFLDDSTFTGTLVVNSKCVGTFEFVTSRGTTRKDSVIVLSPWRIRAMSQDINNLWTYEME